MINDRKSVRLPIMVSKTEAEAIDDWRFKQRVPTRAQAMRQLIDIGLQSDTRHEKQVEAMKLAVRIARDTGTFERYARQIDRIIDAGALPPSVIKEVMKQPDDPDSV